MNNALSCRAPSVSGKFSIPGTLSAYELRVCLWVPRTDMIRRTTIPFSPLGLKVVSWEVQCIVPAPYMSCWSAMRPLPTIFLVVRRRTELSVDQVFMAKKTWRGKVVRNKEIIAESKKRKEVGFWQEWECGRVIWNNWIALHTKDQNSKKCL